MLCPGGGARAVLLEQRVHNVSNIGQREPHPPHHVPLSLSQHQESLEQDHTRARVQRAQAVHGDEPKAVRRVHAALQGREAEVTRFVLFVGLIRFY